MLRQIILWGLMGMLAQSCTSEQKPPAKPATAVHKGPNSDTAKPTSGSVSLPSLPNAKAITVTIRKPKPEFLSPEEKKALNQEVKMHEKPLKSAIEDYGRNLDNVEKKRFLENELRENSSAYKEKVLSLVKDELKRTHEIKSKH
jgi:hypothetical protein